MRIMSGPARTLQKRAAMPLTIIIAHPSAAPTCEHAMQDL